MSLVIRLLGLVLAWTSVVQAGEIEIAPVVAINDGEPRTTWSRVTSLTLTYPAIVEPAEKGIFLVNQQSGARLFPAIEITRKGKKTTRIRLTFPGTGVGLESGLADGHWNLIARVHEPKGSPPMPTRDYEHIVRYVTRYFGDLDHDGDVDEGDKAAFDARMAMPYAVDALQLDSNGDQILDAKDAQRFQKNYNHNEKDVPVAPPPTPVSAPPYHPKAPVAAFTASVSSGAAPLVVRFHNQTKGATSVTWQFGASEVSTSTEMGNEAFLYSHPNGYSTTYTVSLLAKNSFGQSLATRTIVVTPGRPHVGFSTPTDRHWKEGLQARFYGRIWNVQEDLFTRLWNLGNGKTTNAESPLGVYTTPGNYTVSLTATNQFGTDALTRPSYITLGKGETLYTHERDLVVDRLQGNTVNLYESYYPPWHSFVRNLNHWLAGVTNLGAMMTWWEPAGGWQVSPDEGHRHAATLVAPNYAITATHYALACGNKLYFLGPDNVLHQTTVVQRLFPNSEFSDTRFDVAVLKLDPPVPVPPVKFIRSADLAKVYRPDSDLPLPVAVFNQFKEARVNQARLGNISTSIGTLTIPALYPYVGVGVPYDSGNPITLIIGNELVLVGHFHGGLSGPTYLDGGGIEGVPEPSEVDRCGGDPNAPLEAVGPLQYLDLPENLATWP